MAPTLTAVAQTTAGSTPVARTLLTLTWPGIQTATIQRLDPDGVLRNVRNAEPVVCLGSCAVFDHEAPLDQAVTYRATSPQGTGAVNANIYFEAGVANWTGSNGATLASSGTQHHEGALALRITPDGVTANTQAQGEEDPVIVGTSYGYTAWLWATASATWQVGISWYTAAHALISQSLTAKALGPGVWTYFTGSAVAPATAAFGRITVRASATPAGSNLLYVDEAMGPIDPTPLTVTSSSVTSPSGGLAWLSHPGHPVYAAATDITDLNAAYTARRGQFWPIGAPLPVVVTDVRGGGQGTVVWQVDTAAKYQRIRNLIADGGTLLMRLPSPWAGDCWYISAGDITERRPVSVVTSNYRRYEMPYLRVDRPSGASDGAVGQTWNDVKATYATWNAVTAAKATWTALNQSVI